MSFRKIDDDLYDAPPCYALPQFATIHDVNGFRQLRLI